MDDACSYPLLVELEQGDVPKTKIKLTKYFTSRKSGGGDCEVDYVPGSRTAVVRFRTEQDQRGVLSKETHEIQMDTCVLKVSVRLPPDVTSPAQEQEARSDKAKKTPEANVQTEAKGRDDAAADDMPCSTSAILENIPEELSLEFLEMLVENILKDPKSPSASFTMEMIHGISSVVVTFQSETEATHFVARCPENRMFKSKGLSARPLEVTKQVLVEGIQNLNEDLLHLYFENIGVDVEKVLLHEEEQFAIITFKDIQGVQEVMKKKHQIREEVIRVYPFYPSLGAALYGKDRPCLKLPAAFSRHIDDAVWRYLNDQKSAAETVRTDLAKHFCAVTLEGSAVCLSPAHSILRQKDAKAIIKEWRGTVESAFAQVMSQFKCLNFQPDSEVWEECVGKITPMIPNKDVVLVPDRAMGILSVVGFVEDVKKIEQSLCETISQIVRRVQREKALKTQVIRVSPSIFHLLYKDGLQDKLQCLYPQLKMTFRKESEGLIVNGLSEEILDADKVICEAIYALKRVTVEMDQCLLDLLRLDGQEELTNALLVSYSINAAFEIGANRVELLAFSDSSLTAAKDHLKALLMSQSISVEDSSVLDTLAWQDLVSQLEDANSKPYRRLQILGTGQQVVVCGHRSTVVKVSGEVEHFLMQKAKVEESVDVKEKAIIEYIKKCKTSSLDQVKDKVTMLFKKETICLTGCRVDVTHCKAIVENLVRSLFFEKVNVSKPGVKNYFRDKETMYVISLFNDTGCVVQLADETSGAQDDLANIQGSKPVYKLQTSDGVEIAVCKADLCRYPVHTVVNSTNPQLQHNGGLGAALLSAAGPQLQAECDKIIHQRGQLKPGDCVITDAGGQLCCKNIIHAFGPVYNSSAPQKSMAQLKKAIKGSLELAEVHGCPTVALPAISKTQGFPLDVCALTIVKAVKEHCDERYNDNTLKKIHLVNNDDPAVQAMEKAVKNEFGMGGVSLQSLSPHLPRAKPTSANCLGQVTTAEGLNITLTEGYIENATTDVIVNTVTADRNLNNGAVSNAILHAAGPQLQQLINAQPSKGLLGEVIVTDSCQLKSKKVFHVIAPSWTKGQDKPEKILGSIFKNCLSMAEDSGLTSITLSAVGTGKLGFPKDLVTSLMLEKILAFSAKKPKHVKDVAIVLYPGDVQTIQAFENEFGKKFSSASGPFSNVVSGTGMHETKMGSVTIQVVTGDITKETSEIIVNSSNDNFSLKTGVSNAILNAAGPAVEAESLTLGAQPHSGLIITNPGNLRCKKIIHVVGQTNPVIIQSVVKNALTTCVTNGYTSVSLPAIGTGQGNVQARQVADAMFDAVIDVLSQSPACSLKTIRIVIFQPPMLKDFHNSMQHRAQSAAGKPSDKDSGIWGLIKSLFGSGSADKPQKETDFVIKPVEVDPACFHICGDTQAKVASAKRWICDLFSKDQNTNAISDAIILSFSDADIKHISDMQKSMGVSIRIESKHGQASLTIEGFSQYVLQATTEIHRMLKKVRDEEDMKRGVEQASAIADWQYHPPGLPYQSFDPMTNYKLEQAFTKGLTSVKVTIQRQDYTVAMPNGPATSGQGCTLQIKRIDKLKDELPPQWDAMPPNSSCLAVPIQAGTMEYQDVMNLFQATCNRNVIKIERIQNPTLWKSVQIKKRDIEQRNGHSNNERRLFHGTSEATVKTINEHGFNRAYAGKNAACLGNGTYFAVQARYSAQDKYSTLNLKGEKCMYLCQVLTGDFTLGQQNMVVPPAKGHKSFQKYDSVVDNVHNPTMFIIFHDTQAYPEYLITFL